MKKLIVLATLLLIGIHSFAQSRPEPQEKSDRTERNDKEKISPEQRDQIRLKKLTEDLSLNQDQQKQISSLINQQRAEREAVKNETNQIEEKKKKSRQEFESKLKKILTPEQFDNFQKLKEKKRDSK